MAQLKPIDGNEVYATPLYTNDDMKILQHPHVYVTWDVLLRGHFLVLSADYIALNIGSMWILFICHNQLRAVGFFCGAVLSIQFLSIKTWVNLFSSWKHGL